jgi:hypothetical protein
MLVLSFLNPAPAEGFLNSDSITTTAGGAPTSSRLSNITATTTRIRASATMMGHAAGIEPRVCTGRGRAVTASPSHDARKTTDTRASNSYLCR